MSDFPWLSALILVPLAGAVAVALLPRAGSSDGADIDAAAAARSSLAKRVGLGVSAITAVIAVIVALGYETGGGWQFTEQLVWVAPIGVHYALGLDGLGLLMVEALFMIAGARCISLGTRTPMLEIVDAAARHKVNCVGLSFSASFPIRQANQQLRELREMLPKSIEIWIGGGGIATIQPSAGVFSAIPPKSASELVADWHRRHS